MDALRGLGYVSLGSRLKRLSDHLMRESQLVYDHYGIDFDPYLFPIVQLIKHHKSITNSEIKEALNYTQPAVTQAINKLLNKEYVTLITDASDKRKKIITLSEKGETITHKLKPLWAAFEKSIQEITATNSGSFINAINGIEDNIKMKSFSELIIENASETMKPKIEIIPFESTYKEHFYHLNIEWLKTFFYVEPYDEEVLSKPEKYILDKGGFIFFAKLNDNVVGTVALMPTDEDRIYELTKMAVSPEHRGLKIGQQLMQHCIDFAKNHPLKGLILYSNTKLENAIYIYRKYGFVEMTLEADSPYERSDIKMELRF
ncbi:MAG: bifunctional helix-turn-helix transcriptional regulator/GNAT family N-acetyltransferase [bacterium]